MNGFVSGYIQTTYPCFNPRITQQYPTLSLADVYSVLGYFLRHEAELGAYLAERATVREAVRRDNERRFDPQGLRDRLVASRVASTESR